MTSKLKCPFCETELEQGIELLRGGHILGCPKCKRNADDIFWFAMIKAKQDLEFFMEENDKSTTALIERTKELDKCQKDLKIATNALEKYADEDMWETGHRWEVDYIQALFLEQGYKIAKEALEEINRKQD